MLTVRWKTIHLQEVVFQTASVIASTTYGDDERSGKGDIIALEFYDAAHSVAHEPILFGKVFVMNELGKTVADYHLGAW
jgi:hypothetical protein